MAKISNSNKIIIVLVAAVAILLPTFAVAAPNRIDPDVQVLLDELQSEVDALEARVDVLEGYHVDPPTTTTTTTTTTAPPSTTTTSTTVPSTTTTTAAPTTTTTVPAPEGSAVWVDVQPGSAQPEVTEVTPYPDSQGVQFLVNGVVDERCTCRPNGYDATGPEDGSIFHIYPDITLVEGDVLEARWTSGGVSYSSTHVVEADTSTTTTTAAPTTTTPPPSTTVPPSSGTFLATFDGDPASPETRLNNVDGWFTSPIVQSPKGWDNTLTPMIAQHGTDCAGPPATRPISGSFAETVFGCKDHIMTAMNPKSTGTANSMTNLQPNQMLDLSSGNGTVKIDVSTKSPTPGSWWEIWFTPKENWIQHPSDHWLHMSGVPKRAMKIQISDFGPGDKRLQVEGYDNYQMAPDQQAFGDSENWQGTQIGNRVSFDDRSRDTYEIEIRENRYVDVYITDRNTETRDFIRSVVMPQGFLGSDVVVQFADANYEPDLNGKVGCSGEADCPKKTPATWHWDNAFISPAKPYQIIKSDQYSVNGGYVGGVNTPQKLTFAAPAPAGAKLAFVGQAVNNNFDVSFDGGATWVDPVAKRPANDPPGTGIAGGAYDLLHFETPTPVGATEILIRGQGSSWSTSYLDGWGAMSFAFVTI